MKWVNVVRPNASTRTRIVGWMVLLVALALGTSAIVTRSLLLARVDDQVADQLLRETAKFRQFAATSRDPATGDPYADTESLLTAYLHSNLPGPDETFFSVVDGRASQHSPYPPPARLDTNPTFVGKLARATKPSRGWVDSDVGRVCYAVIPVRVSSDQSWAALTILEFRDFQRRDVNAVTQVLLVTAFGALLVAGSVSWILAGRILAPIRLVRQTAERIGESDLGRRIEVSGNDDVAALARTFNHMLGRLEEAFAAQRRFLDDVVHELRTPITVIQGHLELLGTDPEEQHDARALVLDELGRMNRIVSDLLLLAKAERPDFVTLGEVDLADLTVEVVMKARALGRRSWRVAEVAETSVRADGQRLTQALMQLAYNAVQHTEEDGLVEAGSAVRDGRVLLWVRDDGPGVALEDRDRIFERFATARGQRPVSEDDHAGLGVGLAIVRRIAQAHGGTARVEDADGAGARFVLDLPLYVTDGVPQSDDNPHRRGREPDRSVRGEGAPRSRVHHHGRVRWARRVRTWQHT